MKHFVALAAVAAASFVATAPAQAATLQYSLTGDYSGSWLLDSNPVPDDGEDGLNFIIWDVTGFPDAVLGIADLTFWNGSALGGLTIEDFWGGSVLLDATGPQLYSGPEASPTLLTGSFDLEGINDSEGSFFTLTVTELSGAIPEPSTWAVLVLGFGAIGGAMRSARRTQRKSVSFAF